MANAEVSLIRRRAHVVAEASRRRVFVVGLGGILNVLVGGVVRGFVGGKGRSREVANERLKRGFCSRCLGRPIIGGY